MGVKISDLPAISVPSLSDEFPVVQSGTTYKETISQLSSLLVTPPQVQSSAFNFSVSGGSSDTFTVTLNPVPTAYTDGLLVAFTANHSNVGPSPTLNVNGLGAKNIVLANGINLLPSDIDSNSTYLLIYSFDNNVFELINPSISGANATLVQSNTYNIAADTGVINAYVATLNPEPVALQSGVVVYLEVSNTNTGPSTLALNGNAAAPIVTTNKSALAGGEMVNGSIAVLVYYSGLAKFVLLNSALNDPNAQNGASRYVVDGGGNAQYTTIQSAITAAVANTPSAGTPGVIYIWAGTYNENLTLADYVYLVGVEYGAVTVNGTMTYAGTGAFYMQNIFANQTGGAATFIASGTGVPTLNNCNLMNTGGNCFQGSAINNPSLINVTLNANAGAKHFALSAGCVVGLVNGLGNYTDTASTLSNAGLFIENCSLGGSFVLTASTLVAANSSVSVFNENLSFCAMDNASVFRAQNSSIYSAASSAQVVSGPGIFVADMVSLTGPNQTIDPLVQIQGGVNYLGYVVRASTFVPGFISVATGSTGGTTAINAVLGSYYEFTGTVNQIATLPNANICYNGQSYTLDNQSTGVITVQNYGNTTLFTMQPHTKVTITLYSNAISNGTWLWNWLITQSTGYNPVANYVVSSVAGQAQYQTIQSAINAALAITPNSTTPALIWVFGGNYTENLTLYPWIDLAAASDPSTSGVNVIGNAVYAGTGNISLNNIGFTTNNTNAALSFQSSGAAEVHLQSIAIDAASGKGLECTSATTTINCSIGSISAGAGGKCVNITAGFVEFLAISAAFTDTASTISGGEFRVFSCDLADAYSVTGGIAEFVGSTYVNSGSLPCFNIGASGSVFAQNVICNSSSGTNNFVTGTGTFLYTNVSAVGGAQGIDTGLSLSSLPQYTGTQNVLGFVNTTTGNGNGSFDWVPQTNTVGDFVCQVSNATNIAQSQICTIPDIGSSGAADFIMSNTITSGVQHISSGSLQVDAGNVTVAAGNSFIAYPSAANSGQLLWTATNNSLGNYNTTITNTSSVAQAQTISIPDSGTSSASFILNSTAASGQFIYTGYLQVESGNIYIGNTGGTHSLVCYPAGSSNGLLSINATTNSTGNFSTTLTNASAVAQNQTITIPDSGASTATVLLTSSATPQTMAVNKYLVFDVGTQTGSGGGGVWNFTLTNQCGIITTGSDTLGPTGSLSFIVTNANVTANSVIIANPGNNSGATSFSCIVAASAGTFLVQLYNISPTLTYTQAFQVHYMIVSL